MPLTDDATSPPPPPHAALCVLASGSSANCSVIAVGDPETAGEGGSEIPGGSLRRLCLVDLGLSPKRTLRLLAERGLRPDQIDDILLTHLDSDHLHPGWTRRGLLPPHVRVRAHAAHERGLAHAWPDLFQNTTRSAGGARFRPFEHTLELDGAATVRVHLAAHDEDGAASFRFDFGGAGSLGYATDLGCITSELIEHLFEVDVLAIESNYCPRMQEASGRPEFLKQRIMGGRGHLSNHQALEAIRHIEPRMHVVLLHLSRQCNEPALAASLHEGCDYALTIASQEEPTRWVKLGRAPAPGPAVRVLPRADATILQSSAAE